MFAVHQITKKEISRNRLYHPHHDDYILSSIFPDPALRICKHLLLRRSVLDRGARRPPSPGLSELVRRIGISMDTTVGAGSEREGALNGGAECRFFFFSFSFSSCSKIRSLSLSSYEEYRFRSCAGVVCGIRGAPGTGGNGVVGAG